LSKKTIFNHDDQYLDLKGLSKYSGLSVRTLRDHIKTKGLPCFKVKGKILVRKSEFDDWMEQFRVRKSQDINRIVDEVMASLKR
jgi:excisionase family DNA binding protein